MKKIFWPVLLSSAITPSFVFAQNITDIMDKFTTFFGYVVLASGALAFAAFFWGAAIFIFNVNDEKKRSEGKSWMVWGVVALFVMVTIWGILGFLTRTVGVMPLPLPPLG